MKLVIGSDHGGFDLKEELKPRLLAAGHTVEDMGCYNTDSVDYPDIAGPVGQAVVAGKFDLGILICGTGIGVSIAANKVKGVRAALLCDVFSAKMARIHNNANIVCLGARVTGSELAWEILSAHLSATFEGGRHQQRLDKVAGLEK